MKKAVEKFAMRATRWIGSPQSIVAHSLIFIACFLLIIFGVNAGTVLLVLTTIVSLEAIYLSIFIQMSVNKSDRRLRVVSRDIDEIQEDVAEIGKDIDEIQKDVDEIQEDVQGIEKDIDEIQEDVEEIEKEEELSDQDIALAEIKIILADLMKKLEQK
jgi:peptidoglycan hydrolase CwlO-like protein